MPTKTVQRDENGEPFLEFTDEEMEELGWKPGDTVVWSRNEDGSYTLSKKENRHEE